MRKRRRAGLHISGGQKQKCDLGGRNKLSTNTFSIVMNRHTKVYPKNFGIFEEFSKWSLCQRLCKTQFTKTMDRIKQNCKHNQDLQWENSLHCCNNSKKFCRYQGVHNTQLVFPHGFCYSRIIQYVPSKEFFFKYFLDLLWFSSQLFRKHSSTTSNNVQFRKTGKLQKPLKCPKQLKRFLPRSPRYVSKNNTFTSCILYCKSSINYICNIFW